MVYTLIDHRNDVIRCSQVEPRAAGEWLYYQAFGVLKAARFGFFLVRARTNMDPNKWMIFAYDGVPAHGDSATPLALYVQSLCFPTPPPPPPLDVMEQV